MERSEPTRWSFRSNPKRAIITLIVVTVLALVIGGLGGWAFNRASAAPAEGHRTVARCMEMDGQACPSPTARDRRAAKKWRAGRIHHASGFNPRRAFVRPVVARRVWVNKITRTLRHANARQQSAVHRRLDVDGTKCTDRQCAFELYGQMVRDAGCVDAGQAAYPIDPGTCKYPDSARRLTKDDIQNGGMVILCGGSVAIGAATSTATFGTTAFIAAWGATACGWAFWTVVD